MSRFLIVSKFIFVLILLIFEIRCYSLGACARSARQRLLTSASVPRPSWRLRRMFFTVPFCSPVSADAPSVLLRSVSTVVEQFFKIRIQQAMTDEVASFGGGAAELNVHRLHVEDSFN